MHFIFSVSQLFLLVFFFNQGFAQKPKSFEGIVKYAVNINAEGMDEAAKALLGNIEQVVFIKGEKARIENDLGVTKTISISDAKAKQMATFTEVFGMKYKIQFSPEDLNKQEESVKAFQIKELEETKTIAGYLCKSAELSIPGMEIPFKVFYTGQIVAPKYSSQFYSLDGFPLEYTTSLGGISLKYVAEYVKVEKVSDKLFEHPSGYTETSLESLQKMFGGMME
jgi:GLPGLI family protein